MRLSRSARMQSPERAMLLSFARADWRADTPERQALLSGALDWPALLREAMEQRLAPRLAWWAAANEPAVPASVVEELRQLRRACLVEELALHTELRQLLCLLAEAGVPAIPYKGPLLGLWLEGEPGLRPSGDLDVLVRPADLARAQDLLAARGYSPKLIPRKLISQTVAAELPDMERYRPGERSDYEYSQHWFHATAGLQVDLHHHVGMISLGMQLSPALVWAMARPGAYDGVPGWRLPAELWLVLLCAHGVKHHWQRLRWLADVATLLAMSPELDWAQTLALARAGRSMVALASGLLLAEGLLGARLPPAVRAKLRRSPAARLLAGWYGRRLPASATGRPSSLMVAALGVVLQDNPLAALAWLWAALTRPTDADRARLPKGARWLAPAARPLRLAWNYLRG